MWLPERNITFIITETKIYYFLTENFGVTSIYFLRNIALGMLVLFDIYLVYFAFEHFKVNKICNSIIAFTAEFSLDLNSFVWNDSDEKSWGKLHTFFHMGWL